jgi:TPR repeat protein
MVPVVLASGGGVNLFHRNYSGGRGGAAGVAGDSASGIGKGLTESAEKGNARAQLHLGQWYESKHTYAKAAEWFRKAAGQGNIPAEAHLGLLYAHGQGVATDYEEAAKWLWNAADGGNIPAQDAFGELFRNGQGVPRNDVEACKWFYIAAAQSDREAAKRAQALEKTMSPEGVAQAQRLAREWMQQHHTQQ